MLESPEEKLVRACKAGNAPVLADALAAGADPNTTDSDGVSALVYAAMSTADSTAGATRALLQAGADPNRPLGNGWTPLIAAAWAGRDQAVAALIGAGADVNAQDRNGATALHQAAANTWREVVRQLLCAGADVSIRTSTSGQTPLDLATRDYQEDDPVLVGWLRDPTTVPCDGGGAGGDRSACSDGTDQA